jgi:uncharacterized membrane protein SirB2
METFIIYSQISIGIPMIIFALVMHTKNFQSAMVFKVLPLFSGLILIFNGLKMLGII